MTREDIEKKMHEAAEEIKPLITTLVEALCEAHQKGYLAGVELGVKMAHPQWIPVEERLPDNVDGDSERVLFVVQEGIEFIGRFDWDLSLWRAEGLLFSPDEVTHWMPIVPPRKEE